jgi:ABC-type enterobactin transport system permease subunit
METQKRRVRYVVGIAFVVAYCAAAGSCAFLKAATPLGAAISWAEVILGPAITVGACLLLLIAGFWVERVIRS